MGASYWGLLAKVGPYRLTKNDEKHLHERGSGLHYNSAFTRMMPSSMGAETLPSGIQSQEAWLPKIDWGMYENPKFQQGITGRGYTFRPGQTTDRDRAIFNTMENRNALDQNVSNLNTERRPSVFMDGSYTPAGSPSVINPTNRPRVSPIQIENSNFISPASMSSVQYNSTGGSMLPTPPSSPRGTRRRRSLFNEANVDQARVNKRRRRGSGPRVVPGRRISGSTESPPGYPSPTPTYASLGNSGFPAAWFRQEQYERGIQSFVSAPQYRVHGSNASSRTTSPIAHRTRSRSLFNEANVDQARRRVRRRRNS